MNPVPAPEAPRPPRRLRIAMLGCQGIPVVHGGIERHVEEIARRLVARGHAVDVFTRTHHPFRGGEYAGIRLLRRPSLNTKHLDTATHSALCVLEAALSRRYDLLHVHGIGPGLFVGWTARALPTVFTYHAQDWRQKKWGRLARWSLRRGEATAVRRAHAVIVVSRLLERYVRETYGRRAHYIPNGAVPGPVAENGALRRWGLAPGRYLLFVGRLIADRGLGTLLDAFARLGGDLRLAIAGEVQMQAGEFAALRRRADARVVFTGFQPADILAQLYAHAWVCVHPSEVEGLPIAVLEAMSHGRAVVVSDIPENLEAVGDAGVSFQVGNPDDLQAVLAALMREPERVQELGRRARHRVESAYNWEDIALATERVYLSVLPPRGSPPGGRGGGAPGRLAETDSG
jgi:glycosyltransferase involved in cell wall biosynthesis